MNLKVDFRLYVRHLENSMTS